MVNRVRSGASGEHPVSRALSLAEPYDARTQAIPHLGRRSHGGDSGMLQSWKQSLGRRRRGGIMELDFLLTIIFAVILVGAARWMIGVLAWLLNSLR